MAFKTFKQLVNNKLLDLEVEFDTEITKIDYNQLIYDLANNENFCFSGCIFSDCTDSDGIYEAFKKGFYELISCVVDTRNETVSSVFRLGDYTFGLTWDQLSWTDEVDLTDFHSSIRFMKKVEVISYEYV